MISIYQILCMKTYRIYVGQTNNYSRRLRNHKSRLNLNEHYNERLQKDWNEYGSESFEFKKLESGISTSEDALERETYWYMLFKNNPCFEVVNGVQPDKYCHSAKITNEMVEDAKNGITQKEWKAKHNISEGVLKKLKRDLGIAGEPIKEVLITDEMIFDAKNQISQKDWKEKYNCSTHILKKIRKEHNVPKVPNSKPVEATKEMIEDIENGISQKEWVEKYPYSIGVLKRIKKELGLINK